MPAFRPDTRVRPLAIASLAALAATGVVLAATLVAADEPVGLSQTRPAEGRYVETERGFMVPYTVKIPGTDVEFQMEPIPGGRFRLGSPESEDDRNDDEGPQVEVVIEPFWMASTEVTWAQYKEFMGLYAIFKEFESQNKRQVTGANLADAITAPTELYDPSFTFEYGEEPQLPAVTMTQYAAKQFTKWLSALTGQAHRLPSEAEWEYACRAGTDTAFHFGNDPAQLGKYAWYYENADEQPHRVGEKQPNPWGLYDMHGNVWEWVLDEYLEDGYARLKDRGPVTADDAVAWPTRLFPRVVRGGSWDDDAESCRSAAKLQSHDIDWKVEDPNFPLSPWWFTSDPSRAVGFRVIRPLDMPTKKEMARYWDADVDDVRFDVENRLQEGRGALGLVDETLPEAIKQLQD